MSRGGSLTLRVYLAKPPESTQAEIVDGLQHNARPNDASGSGSLPCDLSRLIVRSDNPVAHGRSLSLQYSRAMLG
jgi:hypothetical protein